MKYIIENVVARATPQKWDSLRSAPQETMSKRYDFYIIFQRVKKVTCQNFFSSIRLDEKFDIKCKQPVTRQKSCNFFSRQNNRRQNYFVYFQEFQPPNLLELWANGERPHSHPSVQPPYPRSRCRGRKSSLNRKIPRNLSTIP